MVTRLYKFIESYVTSYGPLLKNRKCYIAVNKEINTVSKSYSWLQGSSEDVFFPIVTKKAGEKQLWSKKIIDFL